MRAIRKLTATTSSGTRITSQDRVPPCSAETVGQRADPGKGSVWGWEPIDSCSGPRTAQATIWIATRLSSRVETISCTPRFAQRKAATPA